MAQAFPTYDQAGSSLYGLAAELQNQVFEELFKDHVCDLEKLARGEGSGALGFVLSCKRAKDQFFATFWTETTFVFTTYGTGYYFIKKLHHHFPDRLAVICEFRFDAVAGIYKDSSTRPFTPFWRSNHIELYEQLSLEGVVLPRQQLKGSLRNVKGRKIWSDPLEYSSAGHLYYDAP